MDCPPDVLTLQSTHSAGQINSLFGSRHKKSFWYPLPSQQTKEERNTNHLEIRIWERSSISQPCFVFPIIQWEVWCFGREMPRLLAAYKGAGMKDKASSGDDQVVIKELQEAWRSDRKENPASVL